MVTPELQPRRSKLESKEEKIGERLRNAEEQIQYFLDQGLEREAGIYEEVAAFAKTIQDRGGKALLIGGSIRDELLGAPFKDYDLEIYGIEPEDLREITKEYGDISEVGSSFGVIKMYIDGFGIDVSLPRKETSIGEGHKDFSIAADPYLSIEEASKRRDFTIGAMSKDVLTGELHDYFGGKEDIENGILRMVDPKTFVEDPLRVLRAVQFISRFALTVDAETLETMLEKEREDEPSMLEKMKTLSKERFAEEWGKLLLKSQEPSQGLSIAMGIGIIKELYPYMADMTTTLQGPNPKSEKRVWTHSLMTVDEVAKMIRQEGLEGEEALTLVFSALCHDLGKTETTEIVENGKIVAPNHEEASVRLTERFLDDIGVLKKTTRAIIMKLVERHELPSTLYKETMLAGKTLTDGMLKKIRDETYPATIKQLVLLARANSLAEGAIDADMLKENDHTDLSYYPAGDWLLQQFKDTMGEKAINTAEKPISIIGGKDLLDIGFKPGRDMGTMIDFTETMHIDGASREEILEKLRNITQRHREETGETSMEMSDAITMLKKD